MADAPEIRMADLADEVWIEGRDSACAEPLRLAANAAGFEPKICFDEALLAELALATVRSTAAPRSRNRGDACVS
jgi:hypothetical protein